MTGQKHYQKLWQVEKIVFTYWVAICAELWRDYLKKYKKEKINILNFKYIIFERIFLLKHELVQTDISPPSTTWTAFIS